MNWCKVLDHKVIHLEQDNDRDVICARCGSHGYWNQDEWQMNWFWWHLRVWWTVGEWWRDRRNSFIYWRWFYFRQWSLRQWSKQVNTDVDDDDVPF